MNDSIRIQMNRALDEYISQHYTPQLDAFLLYEEVDAKECIRRTQRQKRTKKQVAFLPKIAPERGKLFPKAKKPAPVEEEDLLDADHEERYSISKEFSLDVPPPDAPFGIDAFLAKVREFETFTEAMLRTIREKGLVEADVYNSVFMDRKLFNKIRNDPNYQPSKRTALLLSIALHLTVEETQTFLGKAGFSLTHTSKVDIVIEFFMLQGNYNIHDINEALYDRDLPLLNPRT